MPESDDPELRAAEARVGTTLGGKWKLGRLLGVGGMASVYSASHRNGAIAAIKILHPEFARTSDIRSRFMREGYIANAAGPGAVRVLDDDIDDDGAPYLVMELLQGEPVDVRAAHSGERLSVMEVLWIASETLATLEVAHAQGIIHRDLKPGNLFWTLDGAVKVLDFGIARLHGVSSSGGGGGERTMTGTVLGTPTFMAHEQALGLSAEVDARSDLWAVGAIMFHLLTGQDVHPGGEGNELVAAATKHAPSLAAVDPSMPREIVAIVDRALEFAQSDRYQTARAMREDILRLASVDAMRAAVGSAPAKPARASGPSLETKSPATAPDLGGGFTGAMSDDDTQALRSLLELVEFAVLSRQELEARGDARSREAARLGTFRRLEMAYRHAVSALSTAHIGLFWNVLPDGFATRDGLLWVAKPPLPPVPQTMFDSGVRMLGLLPGLTFEEFGDVTRILHGDLAPFTDYATLLQSSQLPHLVYRIDPTKPGMPEHPSMSIDSTLSGRASVLPMVQALTTTDPALRAALLRRLERLGEGQEDALGALLPTAGVELAMGLLRVLEALATEGAREAMRLAETNPSVLVRIEALRHRDPGGDRLASELREALSSGESAVRIERLVALEVYKMRAAGPALALRVTAGSFDMLPVPERRQALSTLAALLPARAETIAVRLVSERRVLSAEAHEATRELACEILGRIGVSHEAEAALLDAVRSGVKTAERVRIAAAVALDAFNARAAWAGGSP